MLETINKLAKVELHLHLDGSVDLQLAAKLTNMSISDLKEKMIAKDKCNDLSEYLTKFALPIELMQTRENLFLVAKNLVDNLEKQNVIYAEIRFAPMFHVNNNLTMEGVVEAVLEGIKTSKTVKTNLILCLMKGASEENNYKTIEIAKKYLNKGVCGIDLAGDEIQYPLKDYMQFFEYAKNNNIPFTIHAGEAKGASEVKEAIEMGARRIGHGIHCIYDKEVIKLVKMNNILLEVCPTSNVQTNAVDKYINHPLKYLYEKGIQVSINTDNATVSNIDLNGEYLKSYNELNFKIEDFIKMNIMAIKHAFISEEEKLALIKKINFNI